MSMKYPTHKMKHGGVGASNPDYQGSGAMHDRYESGATDERVKAVPARGEEKAFLRNKTNEAIRLPKQDVEKKGTNESRPGGQSSTPMKLGKIHGFRAHKHHESAHGVTKHDNDTALRFSGNAVAHRIGDRSAGRFTKFGVRIAGLENVNGEPCYVAGQIAADSNHDKEQGHKKQTKGHKEAHAKHAEAKKSGKSASGGGKFNRK